MASRRKTTAKQSAGILLYRFAENKPEVLLVHPGGPFWKNRDNAAWSIPKGEFTNEDAFAAACREFKEETGFDVPSANAIALAPVAQNRGKTVYAWAIEGSIDESRVTSNMMTMEWPPKSGKQMEIPEVDRAAWFTIEEAKAKLLAGQVPLVEELERLINNR